jgi:hypothetical protein
LQHPARLHAESTGAERPGQHAVWPPRASPAGDRGVDVRGMQLDPGAHSPGAVGGDERRARAEQHVGDKAFSAEGEQDGSCDDDRRGTDAPGRVPAVGSLAEPDGIPGCRRDRRRLAQRRDGCEGRDAQRHQDQQVGPSVSRPPTAACRTRSPPLESSTPPATSETHTRSSKAPVTHRIVAYSNGSTSCVPMRSIEV